MERRSPILDIEIKQPFFKQGIHIDLVSSDSILVMDTLREIRGALQDMLQGKPNIFCFLENSYPASDIVQHNVVPEQNSREDPT